MNTRGWSLETSTCRQRYNPFHVQVFAISTACTLCKFPSHTRKTRVIPSSPRGSFGELTIHKVHTRNLEAETRVKSHPQLIVTRRGPRATGCEKNLTIGLRLIEAFIAVFLSKLASMQTRSKLVPLKTIRNRRPITRMTSMPPFGRRAAMRHNSRTAEDLHKT